MGTTLSLISKISFHNTCIRLVNEYLEQEDGGECFRFFGDLDLCRLDFDLDLERLALLRGDFDLLRSLDLDLLLFGDFVLCFDFDLERDRDLVLACGELGLVTAGLDERLVAGEVPESSEAGGGIATPTGNKERK